MKRMLALNGIILSTCKWSEMKIMQPHTGQMPRLVVCQGTSGMVKALAHMLKVFHALLHV